MPSGFQSFTADTGVVQIDENYFNLAFRVKGTFTATITHPSSPAGVLKYVDIAYTGETPLFAFRVDGSIAFGCVIAVTRSGAGPVYDWVFRVCVWGDVFTGTYYIFDRGLPVSSSGFGLEVYDAAGKLVYTSLYPMLKMRAFTNSEASIDSGRTWAVSVGGYITYTQSTEVFTDLEQETTTTWFCRLARQTASGGTLDTKSLGSDVTEGGGGAYNPGGDLGAWGIASSMMVIDVTGL
jgi:hypothetical protein